MSQSKRWIRRAATGLFAAIVIAPAASAIATAPPAAAAFASYTVNSTADQTGGSLCTVQPPTAQTPCTLRAAVAAANTSSNVTINVPAGTYTLTAGALSLSKPMTILGARRQPGPAATIIDGNATDRVISVNANVTLDGLVVRNGAAPKNANGGGILVASKNALTLAKSTIIANVASQGAGIENDGTATITESTFTGNTASGKGGGIFNSGTSTILNSTFDGNTANGGGGIASSGSDTLTAVTVTNNTSNNSNGGGLYRVGGTFTVTSSILAANNASSGRDCYGSPTFMGSNVVQYTPGCNPSGGTLLVLDPMLGALGDNGGPTATRRPVSGSPAIDVYSAPCATPADQRGITRPQPAGGKCDVGAVEVAPLSLGVSLTTNTDTIPVGAATVPLGSIPPGDLIPSPNSTTETSTIRLGTIRLGTIRLGTIRLGTIRLGTIRLGTIRLGTIRLGTIRLGTIRLGTIRLGDGSSPLARINLADVTLSIDGGWNTIFNGTPLQGAPINTLTLADALPYLEAHNVTLDQIDIPALDQVPFAAWLLSGNPLAHIPLTDQLRSGTDADRLNAWCAALKTTTQDPCTAMNVAAGSTITLLDVALNGFSLDSVWLDQILVRDIVTEASSWFSAMPLASFQIGKTALGTIPVSSLPAGYVDCTKVACATATLKQAAQVGAVSTSKSLLDLFNDAGSLPQLQTFSLADLYQGLFDPSDLPWDGLDLNSAPLQDVASPKQPTVTYTATVTLGGDQAANTSVKLTLPPSFLNVPGTLTVDGAVQPDPTFDPNNVATLNLGTLASGVHTVQIAAWAGLTLGPATANADATATAGTTVKVAHDSHTVNVVEALENRTSDPASDYAPADTVTLDPNNPTLQIAQISSPADRDLYKFTIPNSGSTTSASIVLGNLPKDYDMVLYGPATALLRNPPQQRVLPVNDTGVGLYPSGQTLSPDTVQDVPLSPPSYAPGVIAVSANRGTADEVINVPSLRPGDYAIQISGYNGAYSTQPYTLRMVTNTKTTPQCAPPPLRNSGDHGPLTGPETLGPNPHALFVVPQERLFATYGATRAQLVITQLEALATKTGGTILPVDLAGSDVAAQYAAWDQNRCSVDAANNVVRSIGSAIDAARTANPNIDTVVMIGDDSLLPMARVPDRTAIGNESTFGSQVMSGTQSNELSAALLNGYTLTDDAYGTRAGIAINEHELFVPDVALGRLVETPEDIVAQITTFLDPVNGGTLDASTANSALVTGFDFMIDGANQVSANLAANGKTVDSSLIGTTWSAQDLRNKLFSGSAPAIESINTHFDESTLLPAQERNAQNVLDLFRASEVADPATKGDLARRLLFSMGCHSGLSVSDISVGSTTDWAQAVTGANQSGLLAANTGYGLGDDQVVVLTERLMALYAKDLDGTTTAGRALMLAKQQYAATTQVFTPYDEKAMQQVVFYGLPLYNLGGAIPAANASVRLLAGAAQQQTAQTIAQTGVTINGTDPRTGLPVAPLSIDLSAPGAFHRVDTGHGSYYDVQGQTITAQYRPIEPGTTVDVTQRTGGTLTNTAHGVLITNLTTSDTPNFTPKIFQPTIDNSSNEQPVTPVNDAVFPSVLSRVSTSVDTQGAKQQAVITAGQARDPQANGNVTSRLFTNIGGLVEYSTPTDTDFTPPYIATNTGEIVGSTAGFTVVTDGTARRVYVLFKVSGTDGAWKGIDLTPTPQADGTIRWWGGGKVSGNQVEFATQAVDASGNVALSNNKVENFLGSRIVNTGGLNVTLNPATPPSGWYTGPVTATITGPAGATIQYSLDGGALQPYTGPIQIGGDGVHHLVANDAPLGDVGSADISIDTTAPSASSAVAPGAALTQTDASGNTWYDRPVAVTVTGSDPIGGSGVGSLTYSATGANPLPSTTVRDSSSPPLVRSPLGTASTSVPVSADGTTTVTAFATDVAGNQSTNTSATVRIDTLPPKIVCGTADGLWHNTDQSVTCTATDAGIGLLNSSDASFTVTTNVASGTQNANASTNTRTVCDKLLHCATSDPVTGFKIDKVPPTAAITTPVNGAQYTIGSTVLASYSCSDLAGGSGLAATNGCVGTVANGAAIDTTAGAHSFSVTAKDAAGNTYTTTVTYTVGYGVCLLYDPTKPSPTTGTVPVKLQLCDASGKNLSSPQTTLTAVYEDTPGQLPSPNFQGSSNYGFNFRFTSGYYIYNLDPTQPPALGPGYHTLYFVVQGTTAPVYGALFSLK